MSASSPAPRRYLIPDVLSLPSLNLLGGASGAGKTAFLTGFMQRMLAGAPIFGHPTTPPTAIGYITSDRPADDAAQWFEKAALPREQIRVYSAVDDAQFSATSLLKLAPGGHAKLLDAILRELDLPAGALVIVDPIALFLGGDLNHYIKMAVGCINLTRLVLARDLCVIGVVHSSKQKAGANEKYARPQDRLNGSMAQLGYSATQMYLAGPTETESGLHEFTWNPHHAPMETFTLRQREDSGGLFDLSGPQDGPAGDPLTLEDELRATYEAFPPFAEPISVRALCAVRQDVSKATVYRHLDELRRVGLIDSPKYGYWRRKP